MGITSGDVPAAGCNPQSPSHRFPAFSAAWLTTVGLLMAITVWLGCLLLLAAVPPVSRDALTHHLLVPRLYLEHGGMYKIPHIPFACYPMNVDLLYLIPLALGNDIAAKYIHMAFGIMTAVMIGAHLKRRLNMRWALLGALLFLSLPVVVKLSITVYVDLGLVFFSTAALLDLVRWFESGHRRRHLIAAGIWCGLAMGTKPNGLIVFALLVLAAGFAADRRGPFLKAAGRIGLFVLIALVVFSPWMVRNLHWNVSPIYPIELPRWPDLQDRQPGQAAAPRPVRLNHFAYRNLALGESGWRIAAIPLRVFLEGRDDDPQYFDGQLNPYLLLLPLIALWPRRPKDPVLDREMQLLAGFSVCYLLIAFFSTDMRIRYLAPIYGPLTILSVYGAFRLAKGRRERPAPGWRQIGTSLLLALLLVPNLFYLAGLFQRVRPMDYLSGRIDRDAYLTRHLAEYPVLQYANTHLAPEARILALYLGNRLYYSQRHTVDAIGIFQRQMADSADAATVCRKLKQAGFSHLLIRHDLFANWVKNNCDAACRQRLDAFARRCLVPVYRHGVYGLLEIGGCGDECDGTVAGCLSAPMRGDRGLTKVNPAKSNQCKL